MNIVRKDLDQNNVVLTLHIEKADYADKVNKTLSNYRKKANIPGFRSGMVPVGIIKKQYGKAVLSEELNKLVSDSLLSYIRDNNINTLGEPLPNITEQKTLDLNSEEEFEFVFDLGIAPEFEVELNKNDIVKYYEIAISDEMIDNQVKSHTSRLGTYIQEETVEEKDMLKGELLEMTNGKVNENGIKVQDATLTIAYMKDDAQKAFFKGAKKGDFVTFNPAKAFVNESEISSLLKISKDEAKLIEADFQLKIESITRYHEAEINQELFDKVYGEGVVTSETEFRAKISENIQEGLIADSEYKFGMDAQKLLIEKYAHLTFPETFLKRWVLSSNTNLTTEKLEEDFPKMIADLTWQLIKSKLIVTFKTRIETADVDDFAKKMAKAQFAQYGMVGMEDDIIANYANEMLKKDDTRKNIIERVADAKVFASLKDAVKLDKEKISIEEFNKMFEGK